MPRKHTRNDMQNINIQPEPWLREQLDLLASYMQNTTWPVGDKLYAKTITHKDAIHTAVLFFARVYRAQYILLHRPAVVSFFISGGSSNAEAEFMAEALAKYCGVMEKKNKEVRAVGEKVIVRRRPRRTSSEAKGGEPLSTVYSKAAAAADQGNE